MGEVMSVLARLEGDASSMVGAFNDADKGMKDMQSRSGQAADTAGSNFTKMEAAVGKALRRLGGVIAAAFSVRAIANFVKDSIAALGTWQALNAQTEAAITSTGASANVTGEHIHDLAQSLEALTATQAEQIQSNANLLLTFRNVQNQAGAGNDIFDQAVTVFQDMQRANPSASMTMLGKALNDPIAGMAALGRVGVQFTASQKAQIQAMVAAGDVMGAQKLILAELNAEYGGSGAAYAKTYEGAVYRLKDAFGDFGESLLSGVMPALTNLADMGARAFGWLGEQPAVTGFGGALTDVFSSIWEAVKPVATTLGDTLGPILQKVGPQVLQLATAFSPLMLILNALQPVLPIITDLLGTVGDILSSALATALPVVTGLMSSLAQILSGTLSAILPIISQAISSVGAVLEAIMPSLMQVADAIGGALLQVLTNLSPVLPMIGEAFLQIFDALSPLIQPVLDIVIAFLPLLTVLTDIVSGVLPSIIQLLTALLGPILKLITPLIGLLAPALEWVADALSGVIGWLVDSVGGTDAFSAGMSQAASIVGGVFTTMFDVISAVVNGIGAAIGWVVSTTTNNFNTIVKVVQTVGSVFRSVFDAIGGFIKSAFSNAISVVKGAVNGIIGLVNGAIAGLNKLKVTIPDWVPLIGGQTWGVNLPKIPGLANGGQIMAPGLTWVGERGPELLSLPRGATVAPLGKIDVAPKGGDHIEFHQDFHVQATDPAELAKFAAQQARWVFESHGGPQG